ncbi:MAG: VOC family protein [Alphaproteobacteria bacterium]|nr:VOC family protein [Alphaproteobacteria bacterium]
MKLTLHHLNLCTKNVKEMDAFYTDILDMKPEPSMEKLRVKDEGYAGNVSFITDGQTQIHIAQQDLEVGFKTKQAVNPLERGHIAYRTDDIEAVKRRLEEKGVSYSDYGGWAMSGWHQIFFYDPDGNVIEVHQAAD